jgi:hypothetical protein
MKVGVIGAGKMGATFAKRLGDAGHDVFITSRKIDEANQVAQSTPGKVKAVRQSELAKAVDVLIAATPYPQQAEAIRASGDITGKIIVDISNPLEGDMSGLVVGHTTSAAEEIAKTLRGARIVKAFNTIFQNVLATAPANGQTQVFYAGDDAEAKATVRQLIESLHFEPIDAGPLRNARLLEPLAMLTIYLGYVGKLGTGVAPTIRIIQ